MVHSKINNRTSTPTTTTEITEEEEEEITEEEEEEMTEEVEEEILLKTRVVGLCPENIVGHMETVPTMDMNVTTEHMVIS